MNEIETGDWYNISLKHPYYLDDKDYQDYVLFNMFRYCSVIDITLMNSPYHEISVKFDSGVLKKIFWILGLYKTLVHL